MMFVLLFYYYLSHLFPYISSFSQSAEPLSLSELKSQRCFKISAEEMLSLLTPSSDWKQSKPKLVVIDIRTNDE